MENYSKKFKAKEIVAHFAKYRLGITWRYRKFHTDSWTLMEYVKFFFPF